MADRMPVGQVWIRVSPDTRGFARETKGELKKLKSLDNYKVTVGVEIDSEQVENDFAKTVRSLQRKAATEDFRVRIQTELAWSKGDYRRQVREQAGKYQELADEQKVEIKTNLDSDGAASPYSPTVNLAVDDSKFERDVKRLMDQTKAEMKVSVKKKTVREEVREAVDEVGTYLGRLMDLDRNKMQIQVEADDLDKAKEHLAQVRHYYDGLTDDLAGGRRELDRINREYSTISRRLGRARWQLTKINQEAKGGTEEYRTLARRMVALNRQLQVYGAERKRLAARARKDFLAVNMNMESMREAEEQVEELRERVDEIASEIEVGLDRTSIAAVSAELFTLVRPRIIRVYTRLVNSAQWQKFWNRANESAKGISNSMMRYATQIVGVRLLWKTVVDLVRVVPKLDMMIPNLAGVSVAAVSALSAASTLLGSVLTVGADLMRVFNLALALPSVLAGLTGSVLIMGRALKDFQDRFPEIISYWKELGNTVSDRVWAEAEDNVRDLHKALVPILDAGVPDWASAWGKSMGAFADGLKDAVEDGHLTEFLDNSIEGTENAEAGWDSLGSALLRMIGVGSRFFPQMGTWFSDTMQSFEDWVKENDKNGSLERWIDDGVKAFKDFGTVIKATGSILRSLALAGRAAGLPSLNDFATSMSGLADRMRTPGFQDALVGPLEDMVGFMRELKTLGPLVEDALGTLWTMLGDAALSLGGPVTGALEGILTVFTSAGFRKDMNSFFEDMGTFIEDITPGLESLVREFGSMAYIVGVAAKSWGPAFSEMLLLFEDLGRGLRPGLESFLEETGPALEQLVKDLRPAVEDFGKALGDLLGDEDFQEFVRYLLDSLADIAIFALHAGTTLLAAFKGFADWWNGQPEWFKGLSTNLLVIAALARPIATAFGLIKGALGPAIALFGGLARAVGALGRALSGFGARLAASGLARGGIRGLLMKTVGRFLMVGAGPVGWALLAVSLVAEHVPVDFGAILLDEIVDAVGLGDTWLGELTDAIEKNMRAAFGGKTLSDLVAESVRDVVGGIATGDWERAFNGLFDGIGGAPMSMGGALVLSFMESIGMDSESASYTIFKKAFKGYIDDGLTGFYRAWHDAWQEEYGSRKKPEPLPPGLQAEQERAERYWAEGFTDEVSIDDPMFKENVTNHLGPNSPGAIEMEGHIGSTLTATSQSLSAAAAGWKPPGGSGVGSGVSIGIGKVIDYVLGGDPVGTVPGPSERPDWGESAWERIVGPWLGSGWEALKRKIGAWNPEGDGGLGSAIDRAIGTDPTSTERTNQGLRDLGTGFSSFGDQVASDYEAMGTSSRREIEGLADNTDAEFGRIKESGTSKTSSMSGEVVGKMAAMAGESVARMAGMKASADGQFAAMQASSAAKAASMQSQVVGHMVGMAVRSGAQAVLLQTRTVRAMSTLQTMAVARARSMSMAYVAQLVGMSARSISTANIMRASMLRILSINASGPGRSTGSTFVSGLRGGLSRARSVAYAIRGSIRSALSFSAYGSGSTVGGTFASGIRARIRSVRSAAYTMAAAARRALPNSPAAEGPFAGSGWGGWGESIGEEVARGLKYAAPEVAAEAQGLMLGIHDALDAKAEVGLGVSTKALNDAFAGAEVQAAEVADNQLSAADLENGVANGLARLIEPASDRDLVGLVRKANRNGAH